MTISSIVPRVEYDIAAYRKLGTLFSVHKLLYHHGYDLDDMGEHMVSAVREHLIESFRIRHGKYPPLARYLIPMATGEVTERWVPLFPANKFLVRRVVEFLIKYGVRPNAKDRSSR